MLCKWFIQYADLAGTNGVFPKIKERACFYILIVSPFASLRTVALADFFWRSFPYTWIEATHV